MTAVSSGGQSDNGWRIVAALFVVLSFSSGLGFYVHTVLLEAIHRETGIALDVASGAVSMFFLVSGLAGLLIANLLERFDVRLIICGGAICAATALMLLSFVRSVPGLYACYVLFGIGFAGSGLLPATTLVTRWFDHHRARALSVASTGLSIGGVVLTPLCAYGILQFGLGTATPLMALAYLIGVVPVTLLFIRSRPSQRESAVTGSGDVPERTGISFHQAVRQFYFWSFCLTYLLVMFSQVGGIAHQYGLINERAGPSAAAYGIAILPLFSIIGRLAGGWIIDLVSTRRFTLLMIVLQALSLFVMSTAGSVALLYLGLALFGITVGNLLMLQPLLVAEQYGILHYSRLYALANLLSMLGLALGPATMGILAAGEEGYGVAYLVAAGVGVLALCSFGLVSPPED